MSNEAPDLSGILGNLLANPAVLSTLGGILGGSKPAPPSAGYDRHEEKPCTENDPPCAPPHREDCDAKPFAPPCLLPKPPCRDKDPRLCLLLALRPFLSCKRQTMLDGLLRLFEVLELVDRMNGGSYV